MNTKHTPGPWYLTEFIMQINDHAPSGVIKRIVSTGGTSFIIAGKNATVCEGRAVADGRLIAAAPELFDALGECQRQLHDVVNTMRELGAEITDEADDAIAMARAAIAKANGEI